MTNAEYLEQFKTLWEQPSGGPRHTAQLWDERADEWEEGLRRAGVMQTVTAGRIDGAVRFLRAAGALEPDYRVMDVGCGPGRFVTAFAGYVARAEGTDFSGGMLDYAAAYAREQGRDNVAFTRLDFRRDSVAELGWEGAFDLVYSSMTPAIGTFAALEKMISMSRRWCANTSCILGRSTMQETVARALGPERVRPVWDGSWWHVLLNLVWTMGYLPRADYFTLAYIEEREVTRELAQTTVERMLHSREASPEDVDRAYGALREKSREGRFLDECTNWYGTLLWDVREKLPRW